MRLEPPPWWYAERIPLAAWGLLPVSALYGAAVRKRFREAAPYRGKLPVICVGNFTMGGAGKTPVALKLAAMLSGSGLRPGFLTRGYGGRERGPYLVNAASDDAARVGDEPLLLAEAAPTVVSRNRPARGSSKRSPSMPSSWTTGSKIRRSPRISASSSSTPPRGSVPAACSRLGPSAPRWPSRPAWRTLSCFLEAGRAAVPV